MSLRFWIGVNGKKNCFILKFFQIIFLFLLIKLINLTLTTQKRPTPSLREETVLRLVRDNGLFPQKSVMSWLQKHKNKNKGILCFSDIPSINLLSETSQFRTTLRKFPLLTNNIIRCICSALAEKILHFL